MSEGYGKSVSGKCLLAMTCVMNKSRKTTITTCLSFALLFSPFFHILFQFPFYVNLPTVGCKPVCVTMCWFTHTAGAPCGDQGPPRESNKNSTLSVCSVVKTIMGGLNELNKSEITSTFIKNWSELIVKFELKHQILKPVNTLCTKAKTVSGKMLHKVIKLSYSRTSRKMSVCEMKL